MNAQKISALILIAALLVNPSFVFSQTSPTTVFDETFESASPPALTSGWVQSGNTFGTYDTGDTPGKVLYGDTEYPYRANMNGTATSPAISLSGATSATLSFDTRCDTEYTDPSTGDYMAVKFSADGSTFNEITRFNEVSIDSDEDPSAPAYKTFSAINIPSEYFTIAFKMAFNWVTNGVDTTSDFDGCYINNIKITASGDLGGGGGTDTTPPNVSIASVGNDTSSPYSTTDTTPEIVLTGESGMQCRYSTENQAYAQMTNNATINGNEARFTLSEQTIGSHTIYASCQDSAQNASSAIPIAFEVTTTGGGGSATDITACTTLSEANTTYTLRNNINTSSTCLRVTANNITLDGGNFTLTGDANGIDYGVEVSNVSGITIKHLKTTGFNSGIYLTNVSNSTIELNDIFANTYGILWRGGSENIVRNNTTHENGDTGIYLDSGNLNTVRANTTNNNDVGIYFNSSNDNTITSNTSNNNDRGLLFISSLRNSLSSNSTNQNVYGLAFEVGSEQNTISSHTATDNDFAVSVGSPSNNFANMTITGSRMTALRFFDPSSEDNVFDNITVSNTASGGFDLKFDEASGNTGTAGVNDTIISNTNFGRYSIASPGGRFSIRNNFGSITFTEPAFGSGSSFTNDVNISQYRAVISESVTGLNVASTITMDGVPADASNYRLLRNGIECTNCTAITPLNASSVTFRVTGAGTYTLAFDGGTIPTDTVPPQITINEPTATTYNTSTIAINTTTNENSSCQATLDSGNAMTLDSSNDTTHTGSLTSLSNGSHTLQISCTDEANNSASATRTFNVSVGTGGGGGTSDTTAPTVSSFTTTPNPTSGGTAMLSVTLNDQSGLNNSIMPTVTVEGHSRVITAITDSYSGNTWQGRFLMDIENTEGELTVFIEGATDSQGNRMNKTVAGTIAIDSKAPSILGLSDDNATSTSRTWHWSSDDQNALFRFSIDQNATGTPASAFTNVRSAEITGGSGTYYLHVQAVDFLDNESSVVTVRTMLESAGTTTPQVILSGIPETNTSTSTINILVSGNGITEYKYQLDGGNLSDHFSTTTPIRLENLNDGNHTLKIYAFHSGTSTWIERTVIWTISGSSDSGTTIFVNSSNGTNFSNTATTTIRVTNSNFLGSPIRLSNLSTTSTHASTTLSFPLTIVASTTLGNVTVNFPAPLVISVASSTWDGSFFMPIVIPNASTTVVASSGTSATVTGAIELGLSNLKMTFDRAVRVFLPGKAGSLAGFTQNGTFARIDSTCTADSQSANDALSAEGHCKINVGNDLAIWTKHFTTLITFTETTNQSAGNSGGGGGGGGGGGSGFFSFTPSTTANQAQSTTSPFFPSTGGQINPATILIRSDINGDGIVNILDFNLMMVLWNNSGNNIAGDINGDTMVNLVDVVHLIINWNKTR